MRNVSVISTVMKCVRPNRHCFHIYTSDLQFSHARRWPSGQYAGLLCGQVRLESPTRHVFSPVYIFHYPIYHVTYSVNAFSLKPMLTFLYFILSNAQKRNAYGTNRN